MNWRPEGWDKKQPDARCSLANVNCIPKLTSFEAGADAMLEALFKLAQDSPTGTFTIDSKVINIYEVKK